MTNFELFTLMYIILDKENEKQGKSNELLADYVSDLNPFIWKTEERTCIKVPLKNESILE